jgi:D-alanyl-D-alanine dipeptidase
VQQELLERNLALKIWDAYRPYSVTEKIWGLVRDPRYAADPKTGSGHNRGIAVDATIVDLQTARELAMGTGFDNFSDTAHHDFKQLPATVIQNRLLLRSLMEKHGFAALSSEWWHYYLPSPSRYELLDLSFRQLGRLSK